MAGLRSNSTGSDCEPDHHPARPLRRATVGFVSEGRSMSMRRSHGVTEYLAPTSLWPSKHP